MTADTEAREPVEWRCTLAWTDSICRKCGGDMAPGKAIAQTFDGIPDFPGDAHPVTLSPGGPGEMVDVMKCSRCGWSVTPHGTTPSRRRRKW